MGPSDTFPATREAGNSPSRAISWVSIGVKYKRTSLEYEMLKGTKSKTSK